MLRLPGWLCFGLAMWGWTVPAAPQDAVSANVPAVSELYPFAGLSADDAAKAMRVPDGFSVQVGASEPDVRQPIAMALDERGRVWIAEAYQYPQRAPEGQGRDRILIFEDTDGNGSLDRRTVFAEHLNLVSGLEVGYGGVWVGAAPYLLFIPDANHDDKPDGPPQILLDGWAYQDTHETLNSLIWGPDGWLYGCHGVFTHSRIGKPGTPDDQRVPINAGYWRYHPTRHVFEVFAHGTSNPWGIDFNDRGQAFATVCVIPHLFHVIQGARYERQAGTHFNPYTYDDIKTIALHRHFVGNQWNDADRLRSDDQGGGHAHAGAMVYLGGSWPERYRDQIFMHNIHGNRTNMDRLTPRGSGYVGNAAPDFLLTRDQWSQMIALRYGPDGQVWTIDWYDRNQCHRPEVEAHDRSNGRIYRIVYQNTPPVKVDLAKFSDLELVDQMQQKNDWYVRQARRLLAERAAAGRLDSAARQRLAELALDPRDDTRQLRGMWALHVTGGLPGEIVPRLLEATSPYVRGWTIQLLLEDPSRAPSPDLLARLAALAHSDDSPVVRLYLASGLQRLPREQRWDILAGLVSHAKDAGDHNLPLMYWYAFEPLAEVDPGRALALAMLAGERIPLLRQFMVRRIGSLDQNRALALLLDGLRSATDSATRLAFLEGLHGALRGVRQVKRPDTWEALYADLLRDSDPQVRLQATALAFLFGSTDARDALHATLESKDQPAAMRRQALGFLVRLHDPTLPARLQALVPDADLAADAIRSLAAYDDPRTPEVLLAAYASLLPTLKRDALAALCARPSYATALLAAIEQHRVPARDLTADLVRQLRNLEDPQLIARIEQVWGRVRESSADLARMVKRYQRLVEMPDHPAPDVLLGRATFAKNCSQCHTLFGKGGKVGPDLTGSNRANTEYLFSNVLDPSAVMAKEYQPRIVQLEDGRVITGLVRAEDPRTLQLQTADETLVVPKSEIAAERESDKSMMPDDLLKPLSTYEVRSLAAYLASPNQSPMLATDDNVQTLFNGKNLDGWMGNPDLWSVEDGEIVGKSPGIQRNEFLISDMAVGNFHLSLDIKLTPNTENSGIQFRSERLPDGLVKGYQADAGAGWWGKLYEEHGRGLLWDKPGEMHMKPGEWNHYEMQAVGSYIRTWINGQLCVDMDDATGQRRGIVALQIHSGGPLEVRFKNLQLKLLDSIPPGSGDFPTSKGGPATRPISFARRRIDAAFRSEGAAVGDLNSDGLWDIAAGNMWYEAPGWTPHPLRGEPRQFDLHNYSDSFINAIEDLNGDGRPDLIVVDFPGKSTSWFANPGPRGGVWERFECLRETNNESPAYVDVDGDGQRELVCGTKGGLMGLAHRVDPASAPWAFAPISLPAAPGTGQFSHGLGVGDVNGDGRRDVVIPEGWWEAPEESAGSAWTFHAAPLGEPAAQMVVYDFDGDGDADVLSSSAHRTGIWWYEQTSDGWKTHAIDASYSGTHALCLADINGDGLPDFVTGRRPGAQAGGDPGGDQPAVLYWYELRRESGHAAWTRHLIDEDSGVGTQFTVADVDRDGLLDIVLSNRKGVFVFEQQRK